MTVAFDEFYMRMAVREAERAAEEGEVPLGCVIVAPAVVEPAHDGHPAVYDPNPANARVLARTRNQTEGLADATAHAEVLAVSAASQTVGDWRLSGARLYVTKEPCPMCAGAIVLARLDAVVWGVSDPKRGGDSVFGVFGHPGINHHPQTVSGVLEEESKTLLQRFFQSRR